MRDTWTRRRFLGTAAAAGAAQLIAQPRKPSSSKLAGRFLTHVSLVRVNQIEVTPSRSIGQDESADNSPAHIQSRRDAFARSEARWTCRPKGERWGR